jgi:hypothetical protein
MNGQKALLKTDSTASQMVSGSVRAMDTCDRRKLLYTLAHALRMVEKTLVQLPFAGRRLAAVWFLRHIEFRIPSHPGSHNL